jgi:hypothetical protein
MLKESKIQESCVKWFDLQYPEYSVIVQENKKGKISNHRVSLLYAVPNGGIRNKANAITLKKEGVRRGVSDLILSVPNKNYNGLFIEMKDEKGVVSKFQYAFMGLVEKQGYKHVYIRSVEDFIKQVKEYLNEKA